MIEVGEGLIVIFLPKANHRDFQCEALSMPEEVLVNTFKNSRKHGGASHQVFTRLSNVSEQTRGTSESKISKSAYLGRHFFVSCQMNWPYFQGPPFAP